MNPAIVAALITGGAGLLDRALSKGDIAQQNKYNSPKMQVARLREAGLPMSEFGGGNPTGQQSALPETTKGMIGNFINTQMQMKQLEILKADARVKNTEADLNEARRDWLLSGKGEDKAPTNLTTNMKTEQELQQTQAKGAGLVNQITQIAADNALTKTTLENDRMRADIANILTNTQHTEKQMEGTVLDNAIKEIVKEYQPEMSDAQLGKLIADKNLTVTQNEISEIRKRIETATESAQVFKADMEAALTSLTYDRVQTEFRNYNEYQEFVKQVRKEFDKTPWDRIKDPMGTFESMIKFAYTSVVGLSGQGTAGGSIISHIK